MEGGLGFCEERWRATQTKPFHISQRFCKRERTHDLWCKGSDDDDDDTDGPDIGRFEWK